MRHRPEYAEAVDDLVGHEAGMGVADSAVFVVVVTLAPLDVVGERGGHRTALAIAGDEVGHMIADHAAEPAALVAHMADVVTDICRRGDTEGDVTGIPSCR